MGSRRSREDVDDPSLDLAREFHREQSGRHYENVSILYFLRNQLVTEEVLEGNIPLEQVGWSYREWQWHRIAFIEIRNHLCKDWEDARVFPTGSFCKGTPVSPEQSDLDLVVLFDDFSPARYDEFMDLIEKKLRLMPFIHTNLQGRESSVSLQQREMRFYFSQGSTVFKKIPGYLSEISRSVQKSSRAKYIHLLYKNKVKVDILVGRKKLPSMQELHECPEEDRILWSPSCVIHHVEIIFSLPPFVKHVIIRLKSWRSKIPFRSKQKPSSFLLELLTLHVFNSLIGENGGVEPEGATIVKGVFKLLAKPKDIRILFSDEAEPYIEECLSLCAGDKAIVLDPTNPWNNVARRIDDWSKLQHEARRVLHFLDPRSPGNPSPYHLGAADIPTEAGAQNTTPSEIRSVLKEGRSEINKLRKLYPPKDISNNDEGIKCIQYLISRLPQILSNFRSIVSRQFVEGRLFDTIKEEKKFEKRFNLKRSDRAMAMLKQLALDYQKVIGDLVGQTVVLRNLTRLEVLNGQAVIVEAFISSGPYWKLRPMLQQIDLSDRPPKPVLEFPKDILETHHTGVSNFEHFQDERSRIDHYVDVMDGFIFIHDSEFENYLTLQDGKFPTKIVSSFRKCMRDYVLHSIEDYSQQPADDSTSDGPIGVHKQRFEQYHKNCKERLDIILSVEVIKYVHDHRWQSPSKPRLFGPKLRRRRRRPHETVGLRNLRESLASYAYPSEEAMFSFDEREVGQDRFCHLCREHHEVFNVESDRCCQGSHSMFDTEELLMDMRAVAPTRVSLHIFYPGYLWCDWFCHLVKALRSDVSAVYHEKTNGIVFDGDFTRPEPSFLDLRRRRRSVAECLLGRYRHGGQASVAVYCDSLAKLGKVLNVLRQFSLIVCRLPEQRMEFGLRLLDVSPSDFTVLKSVFAEVLGADEDGCGHDNIVYLKPTSWDDLSRSLQEVGIDVSVAPQPLSGAFVVSEYFELQKELEQCKTIEDCLGFRNKCKERLDAILQHLPKWVTDAYQQKE